MTTVPIICHYDGNLVIDENSRPTYVCGKHKGSKVRKGCNFVELKAAIYKATKIDSNEYDISLVSKWVTDDGPIAIEVNDDDDVDSMFCVGMKVIELFVRKEGVVRTTQPQMNVVDYASQPGRSNTAEQSQLWNPYHSYQPPSIYTQPPGLYPQASGYGFMPYPPQTSGFGFMSYPPQSMATQMSNEVVQQNEEDDVQTEDMEGGNSDMNAEPLDSMDIAVSVDEDDTWIDAMNLNNDEPLEDIPEFVDDVEDNVEMEEPLEEDQCNDTIMRRSVMHEVQFSDELYGLECVEKGPRVGMIFKSKESLIEHVSEWSIKCSVSFKNIKSRAREFTAMCDIDVNCPWRLHASVSKRDHSGFWVIKTYGGDHTCSNPVINSNHKQATAKFICSKVLPHVRSNPSYTAKSVQELMANTYQIQISYMRAWKGLSKAVSKIFGDWESSYNDLPQYLRAIQKSNPGTVFHVHTDGLQFWGAFWAFGPSIEGFNHCRPVLSIDGTHLYGKYQGTLLVATGVDANNSLFPLAFAIVRTESTETWSWFFSCIGHFIPSVKRRSITFISDRMKGIPTALQEKWRIPHHHRFCLRHLKANFKKGGFGSKILQNLFHACAEAKDEITHKQLREQLQNVSTAASRWIDRSLGQKDEQWALYKDNGERYCMMTTNASESFNGVLKGARSLPVKALVARTFHRLNSYFYRRRTDGNEYATALTPTYEKMMEKYAAEARSMSITRFSMTEWQVTDSNACNYTVNISNEYCSCSCNIPILAHFPCPHVLAACARCRGGANRSVNNLISPWFSSDSYKKSYSSVFHPVPDSRYWDVHEGPIIQPPPTRRNTGRPRSTRIRGVMDEAGDRRQDRCGQCSNLGHKRRTCGKQ